MIEMRAEDLSRSHLAEEEVRCLIVVAAMTEDTTRWVSVTTEEEDRSAEQSSEHNYLS